MLLYFHLCVRRMCYSIHRTYNKCNNKWKDLTRTYLFEVESSFYEKCRARDYVRTQLRMRSHILKKNMRPNGNSTQIKDKWKDNETLLFKIEKRVGAEGT